LLHEVYDANAHIIGRKTRDLNDNGGDSLDEIEEVFSNFAEAAQATIKGLQVLGQTHPFVGAAVSAFVLVITMDITRRENDRKIMALRVEMHDLVLVFFELRHINSVEREGNDRISIAQRLSPHIEAIARDIKKCASACDAFLKKSFLSKTVKALQYESRFADFSAQFQEHKRNLMTTFTFHMSLGVDSLHNKLDQHVQNAEVKRIQDRHNAMELFHKLDTPREKEVKTFIEENGGVKECLSDDELLEELISRSGESLSKISGRDASKRSNDLPGIRKKLFKELTEDIEDLFSRNASHFNRKLEIQQRQLSEAIEAGTEKITQILLSGSYDRINDADLQTIWKDMGWKGSVKARHFVLALQDHYTDKINSTVSESLDDGNHQLGMSIIPQRKDPVSFRQQNDKWTLAYINAAYVQPILEAFDDDGTGFISIKEVNNFTESCPKGWSLPHWIAYWAVGWQANISLYKNKIYGLIQTMFQTLEHVHSSNKRAVDEYLFDRAFWRIELLLRATRSINPKIMSDSPDLIRMTESYAASEEEKITRNLEDVGYYLDTTTTVTLVTGEGRIERYIFPLLYLLLRRHLEIFMVGCKHVLHVDELAHLSESLVHILQVVDYRIQNLEGVFKQTHLDVPSRLGNFAFGMLSYGDIKRSPIQNSFSSWANENELNQMGKVPLTLDEIRKRWSLVSVKPSSILRYEIQDSFKSTDFSEFEPSRLRHISHPLQGTWSGIYSRAHGHEIITHIVRISLRLSKDDEPRLLAKGEDFLNTFNAKGKVNRTLMGHEFSLALLDDDGSNTTATGFLDQDQDIITMSWSNRRKEHHSDDPFYEQFTLRRTSPSLLRYRYTPQQFMEDRVRSRWAFACNAALHLAQEKLWSRCFLEARFAERRRFVELTARSLSVSLGLTPQNPLNTVEASELEYLRQQVDPSEARFYQATSEFQIQKLPWHAWGCDWCDHRITYSGMLCLQCMADDLSDNIHLCATCIDKSPTARGFIHNTSHDMIKVEETLHDFYFARVVEAARNTVNRVKGLLEINEASDLGLNGNNLPPKRKAKKMISKGPGGDSRTTCSCCNKPVSAPCWACIICGEHTLICFDCESKKLFKPPARGPSQGHKRTHPLVLLRESIRTSQMITTEEHLATLQTRLNIIEGKLTSGLAAVDAKVEERLLAMEDHLSRLEIASAQRFDTIEALIHQLVELSTTCR
ncbi:hypothetical protein HYPSUDRAFT_149043, partial [Hypholoma sublateritium FD-334 SS-4]